MIFENIGANCLLGIGSFHLEIKSENPLKISGKCGMSGKHRFSGIVLYASV
jgi:hypothetical protein